MLDLKCHRKLVSEESLPQSPILKSTGARLDPEASRSLLRSCIVVPYSKQRVQYNSAQQNNLTMPLFNPAMQICKAK